MLDPVQVIYQERTLAELKMAILSASCDVPLAFHDRFSPFFITVFSDSEIASQYHSTATKATCMLNITIAPTLLKVLLERMKVQSFYIAVDGSNDAGLEKTYPFTEKLFDINSNRVVSRFLAMCISNRSSAVVFNLVYQNLVDLLETEEP